MTVKSMKHPTSTPSAYFECFFSGNTATRNRRWDTQSGETMQHIGCFGVIKATFFCRRSLCHQCRDLEVFKKTFRIKEMVKRKEKVKACKQRPLSFRKISKLPDCSVVVPTDLTSGTSSFLTPNIVLFLSFVFDIFKLRKLWE